MQIYSNIEDEEMDDFHRMLYVYACLSEKCIDQSSAVKCLSCVVPHKNPHVKFSDDDTYDKIVGKTNNQLIAMGYDVKSQREIDFEKTVEESKQA